MTDHETDHETETETDHETDDRPTCEACGERHDEGDDGSEVYTSTSHYAESETWCCDCACGTWACAHCERTYTDNVDARRSVDGDVCQRCYELRYTACDHCGDDVRHEDTRAMGWSSTWCDSCYANHSASCDECGVAYDVDDGPSCGCADGGRADGHTHGIGSYHSTQDRGYQIHGPRSPGEITYGIEHELECGRYREETADTMRAQFGSALAGVESDSSLTSGIEAITQPMTLATIRRTYTAIGAETIGGGRAKAHDTDTCGMHIHIGRDALTPATIVKLSAFLNDPDNDAVLTRVFRRPKGRYCAGKGHAHKCGRDHLYGDRGHYDVLNVQGGNTVELRWPKGSTRLQTIVGTVEYLDALIRWLRDHTSLAEAPSVDAFHAWIRRDPHARQATTIARAYLVRRGILPTPKVRPGTTTTTTTTTAQAEV